MKLINTRPEKHCVHRMATAISWLFVSILLLVSMNQETLAQGMGGTITDGDVSWEYQNYPSASGATVNFEVPNGTDHMNNEWWWYRIEGDSEEEALPRPDTETFVGNVATLTWEDVDGRGFDATLVVTLTDTDGG